ncbi:hypothetical protein ACLKMY_24845 [Paraburkholderia mimosarum]|uniref:hypothetical protein n=1 Tax=Paraburkholderia mimosarum TaxID=312026 RepID=UPI0039C151EF
MSEGSEKKALTDGFVFPLEAVQSITFDAESQTPDINGAATIAGQVNAMPVVVRLTATGGLIGAIKNAIELGTIVVSAKTSSHLQ